MLRYAARKLLLIVPLIVAVVTLIFSLLQLAPGTPADRFFTPETAPEVRAMIIEKWGLDQPLYVQYARMMRNLLLPRLECATTGGDCHLRYDLGISIAQERPVTDIIATALPNTLLLSTITLIVLVGAGCLIGIFQATRHQRGADTFASVLSSLLYATPSFWLALMLVLIFGLWLDLLPASGMVDAVEYDYLDPWAKLVDRARHLILPGVALGLAHSAGVARYMRSSMLEVIRQDYLRTARAKGLSERVVIFKHALRNAINPILSLLGSAMPMLFSGSVLIEYIFGWPGMGRTIVEAIFARDTPLIVGCFFVYTVVVALSNLLADLGCALADPRIRFE